MALDISILYRGELSGCNYACGYCPFAKRTDEPAHLRVDQSQVERFVSWVKGRRHDRLGVFFTPWGEALVRPWYQDALVSLSRLPHVERVAIQTNLSCRLDWVEDVDRAALGLWCTYHPGQVTRDEFLSQCQRLDRVGVRYSVGVVGLREHFAEIEALRLVLAPEVYLWVNAYKRQPDYYQEDEIDWLAAIDPLFELNNQRYRTRGRACRAGETVVSVDGAGHIRRCHFINQCLGNLYQDGWESVLAARDCTNEQCGCHIGYIHLKELDLYRLYGHGLLDRSVDGTPKREQARDRVVRFQTSLPTPLTHHGEPIGRSARRGW
ncbi:MAG: STM4011 family radical SAM protein [Planctomycetota bacterium]